MMLASSSLRGAVEVEEKNLSISAGD